MGTFGPKWQGAPPPSRQIPHETLLFVYMSNFSDDSSAEDDRGGDHANIAEELISQIEPSLLEMILEGRCECVFAA